MSDGRVLEISTADLKTAAPVFQTQAVSLSDALTALVNTLDRLGSPWGQDGPGKKFEHTYTPAQKQIEGAAGIAVLGLTSIHEAMSDMAEGYGTQDAAVAAVFSEQGGVSGDPAGPVAPAGGAK